MEVPSSRINTFEKRREIVCPLFSVDDGDDGVGISSSCSGRGYSIDWRLVVVLSVIPERAHRAYSSTAMKTISFLVATSFSGGGLCLAFSSSVPQKRRRTLSSHPLRFSPQKRRRTLSHPLRFSKINVENEMENKGSILKSLPPIDEESVINPKNNTVNGINGGITSSSFEQFDILKSNNERAVGILVLLTVPLAWGTYAPVVKYMYDKIDPAMPGFVFSAGYYVVAAISLGILSYLRDADGQKNDISMPDIESHLDENDDVSITTRGGWELGSYLFIGNGLQGTCYAIVLLNHI